MIASLPVLLQTNPKSGNALIAFLPFILIFVVIYFLMIRPQSKKQKEVQKMITSLQKGDKVLTIGGIYGTIAGVRESDGVIILKIAENLKVEITKSAVAKKLES